MRVLNDKKSARQRLIVGISGASGVAYGIRLLEALRDLKVESHLVMSKAGEMTIGLETGLKPKAVLAKADVSYAAGDIAAPIASGSFKTGGMIVAPCSVRSWSEIATGVTTNLLTRAADVTLKERRPLILLVRETPLHLGHLRSLAQLAEMGAIIVPPVPAFYAEPHTLGEMVDQMTGRVLDLLGYDWPKVKRWGEDLSKGRRKAGIRNQGSGIR
jgi:4-hydroxy-3-polyprenylbenzoate decarboxylase